MTWRIATLTCVVASLTAACGQKPPSTTLPSGADTKREVPTMDVQTDPAALGRFLTLPSEPRATRWLRRAMGKADADIPGPTDYEVWAWVAFSDVNAEVTQTWLGTRRSGPRPVRIPEAIGDALFPTDQAANLGRSPAGDYEVGNVQYTDAKMGKSPFKAVLVAPATPGSVLVHLVTF
jgi:hypothetical protein